MKVFIDGLNTKRCKSLAFAIGKALNLKILPETRILKYLSYQVLGGKPERVTHFLRLNPFEVAWGSFWKDVPFDWHVRMRLPKLKVNSYQDEGYGKLLPRHPHLYLLGVAHSNGFLHFFDTRRVQEEGNNHDENHTSNANVHVNHHL